MLLAVPLPVPLKASTTLRFAGVIPVQSSGPSILWGFVPFFSGSTQELLSECKLFDLTELEVATLASSYISRLSKLCLIKLEEFLF